MILVKKCDISQNRTASPEYDRGRAANINLHPTISVEIAMEFTYDTSRKEEVGLVKALLQALQDVRNARRSRKKQ
jgi:hypothetical protein